MSNTNQMSADGSKSYSRYLLMYGFLFVNLIDELGFHSCLYRP